MLANISFPIDGYLKKLCKQSYKDLFVYLFNTENAHISIKIHSVSMLEYSNITSDNVQMQIFCTKNTPNSKGQMHYAASEY